MVSVQPKHPLYGVVVILTLSVLWRIGVRRILAYAGLANDAPPADEDCPEAQDLRRQARLLCVQRLHQQLPPNYHLWWFVSLGGYLIFPLRCHCILRPLFSLPLFPYFFLYLFL